MFIRNPEITRHLPHGTVFIAYRQTTGRGRGPNAWVSPRGCLQFSLVIDHENLSTLATIQHLFALSIVESLRSRPGYQDLPIRIKWPNDIYVAYPDYTVDTNHPSEYLKKLGGILISSTNISQISHVRDSYSSPKFRLIIGCGLNVNNLVPTDCLNHVIDQFNFMRGTSLAPLSFEEVLVGILSKFSEMHTTLEQKRSFAPFRELYHNRWLHSNQLVNIVDLTKAERTETLIEASPPFGRVLGIGPEGFLMLQVGENTIVEVQPDGNSFDVFHRLVKIRQLQSTTWPPHLPSSSSSS